MNGSILRMLMNGTRVRRPRPLGLLMTWLVGLAIVPVSLASPERAAVAVPPLASSTVTVSALGATGTEIIHVEADGTTIGSSTVGTKSQDYSFDAQTVLVTPESGVDRLHRNRRS